MWFDDYVSCRDQFSADAAGLAVAVNGAAAASALLSADTAALAATSDAHVKARVALDAAYATARTVIVGLALQRLDLELCLSQAYLTRRMSATIPALLSGSAGGLSITVSPPVTPIFREDLHTMPEDVFGPDAIGIEAVASISASGLDFGRSTLHAAVLPTFASANVGGLAVAHSPRLCGGSLPAELNAELQLQLDSALRQRLAKVGFPRAPAAIINNYSLEFLCATGGPWMSFLGEIDVPPNVSTAPPMARASAMPSWSDCQLRLSTGKLKDVLRSEMVESINGIIHANPGYSVAEIRDGVALPDPNTSPPLDNGSIYTLALLNYDKDGTTIRNLPLLVFVTLSVFQASGQYQAAFRTWLWEWWKHIGHVDPSQIQQLGPDVPLSFSGETATRIESTVSPDSIILRVAFI